MAVSSRVFTERKNAVVGISAAPEYANGSEANTANMEEKTVCMATTEDGGSTLLKEWTEEQWPLARFLLSVLLL